MRQVLSLCLLLAALMVAAPNLLSEEGCEPNECCEIGGDANDDGIVDVYDIWFSQSFSYGDYVNADYPYPNCIDQMLPLPTFVEDSSVTPWDTCVDQGLQNFSVKWIGHYLFYDTSEIPCGPLNR